jgi:nitrite reductase/ring-hydroxylating ferredoxin subunit/uncharacterized membrane protein
MRSAAHFQGHPLHPALIPFPFAFLTGAFLFDVAGRATGHANWWMTGGYLAIAGILTALLAAVPGLIDYLRTVPPNSSGKRRATKHMLLNLSAVTLFIVATLLRGNSVGPVTVVIVLEGLAVAMLFIGGWLGGVLVSRNQISVDHRYARGGKWNEESVKTSSVQPIIVARSDELEVDQMKLLRLDGRRLVLARTKEGYVAFDDGCTHKGGSLAGGVMIGGVVQCPWHGSQFDCRSGAVKAGPATEAVETYRVREQEGKVMLSLGDRGQAQR